MNQIYISDYHHINNDINRKNKIQGAIRFLFNNAQIISKKYKPKVCFIEYPIGILPILDKALSGNPICKKFIIDNDYDNPQIGQERFNFLTKLYYLGVKIIPCDSRLWRIEKNQIQSVTAYIDPLNNPFNTSHTSFSAPCENIKCNQDIVSFINQYNLNNEIDNYIIWFGEKHAAKNLLMPYARQMGCKISFNGIAEDLQIPYFQFDEIQNKYFDNINYKNLI